MPMGSEGSEGGVGGWDTPRWKWEKREGEGCEEAVGAMQEEMPFEFRVLEAMLLTLITHFAEGVQVPPWLSVWLLPLSCARGACLLHACCMAHGCCPQAPCPLRGHCL